MFDRGDRLDISDLEKNVSFQDEYIKHHLAPVRRRLTIFLARQNLQLLLRAWPWTATAAVPLRGESGVCRLGSWLTISVLGRVSSSGEGYGDPK